MQLPERIETARLILRPWREDDAEACFRYASDPRVGPSCGWKPHENTDESREVIRTILSAPLQRAITLRGSDEPIGSIGLQPCSRPEAIGHMELGYWVAAPFWGQGIAPEAGKAMLDTAFDLGATELWICHFAENHQSRRVIKKLGFSYRFRCTSFYAPIGEEKEVWYYSLPREAREQR